MQIVGYLTTRGKDKVNTMKYSDSTHCYMIPSETCIIDAINPETGKTWINGNTESEVLAKNPTAIKLDFETAAKDISDAMHAEYCNGPKEITKDQWFYALEVLPPVDWRGDFNTESFKMSERLCGNITAIYCRIGSKYYETNESIYTKHEDIVKACRVIHHD